MDLLTAQQLKGILPYATDTAIGLFLPYLNNFMPMYQINTAQRVGAFIAQVGVESMSLSHTTEIASGSEYERNKQLGNVNAGDGVKYKGRGLIQITGRAAYRQCSLAMFGDNRAEVNPLLISTPIYATRSACWFWADYKNINPYCDNPEDFIHPGPHQYTKIQWLSVMVNGSDVKSCIS